MSGKIQLKIFEEKAQLSNSISSNANTIPITFRNSIPEIPDTTYGTFSIYKYPAKFIPQVIAYVLKNYAKSGMKIFDPFGGYSTTGLVSRVYGYDYELWDLNPLIEIIHNTSILEYKEIDIDSYFEECKLSNKEFIPDWSNIKYWFPEEFLTFLFKIWGYVHSLNEPEKLYFLIPLLKVTKYFSYDDEKVHKLYKSKYSKLKIEHLLKSNWKEIFFSMWRKEILKLLRKIWEYNKLNPKKVNYNIKSSIDTLNTELDENVNILITSPPYLQAQEYIRSTKLDLYWLGYKEDYIKSLAKLEIPYRKIEKTNIYSDKFYEYREKIKEKHLIDLYNNYFHAILQIFSRLSTKVEDYMFIFVGPAKIRNLSIPIDDIIVEHLKNSGWTHKKTYIDKIVSRVMFESKINPASGIEDSRMKTEHLIVLEKILYN